MRDIPPMLAGIAVRDPYEITDAIVVRERLHTVGGHPEMWFLAADRERVLPVYSGSATLVVPWGGRRGDGCPRPCESGKTRSTQANWPAWSRKRRSGDVLVAPGVPQK